MKRVISMVSGIFIFSLAGYGEKIEYPETKTVKVVEEKFGIRLEDPYRWMEDLDSPDLKKWIKIQNKLTFSFLEKLDKREEIKKRLKQLWKFEYYGVPRKRGNRYFFSFNDGSKDQPVVIMKENDEEKVVIDPNKWSKDGTVSLAFFVPSESGRYIAYGISEGGSDWRTIKVLDLQTGKLLADKVEWVKFSTVSWLGDEGFFYSRYPAPKEGEKLEDVNYFHKVYFHKLGEKQNRDLLVYERKDKKEWGFSADVTDDKKFLIITVWKGTDERNLVFYTSLSSGVDKNKIVELIPNFENSYIFIGNDDKTFYFLTDNKAERKRVIAVDISDPVRDNWKEVIPESNDTLVDVVYVGGKFFANYLSDAKSKLVVYGTDGSYIKEIALGSMGTIYGLSGRRNDDELFFSFTSFVSPPYVYRYIVSKESLSKFKEPSLNFDPSEYQVVQSFYRSKDGTRIPIFIVGKKGFARGKGKYKTILYGYGGFNIPITPRFRVSTIVWLELGGLYAVANLRGGGEYGRSWHDQGRLHNKQNVFDDFIYAAKYLIREGYTDSKSLGITGRSNGGLLIGAVITQEPSLFGAAVPAVGVLDMLRFHKFTIGWAWVSDYGDPEKEEDFRVLYSYSPYHKALKEKKCYPPTLILTADYDDRVVPSHSFKFAAALQKSQICNNPILIRVESRAGHGAGTPVSKKIEEDTDILSFFYNMLKLH